MIDDDDENADCCFDVDKRDDESTGEMKAVALADNAATMTVKNCAIKIFIVFYMVAIATQIYE
jgi:hypothetical protein